MCHTLIIYKWQYMAICYHPNEKFTYRYLLLDDTDEIMKYKSRHFNIPCSIRRREKITETTFLPPGLLVFLALPIWILIDMQR